MHSGHSALDAVRRPRLALADSRPLLSPFHVAPQTTCAARLHRWTFGRGFKIQQTGSRQTSALRRASLLSSNHNQTPRSPYAGLARRGSVHRAILRSLRNDSLANSVGLHSTPAPSRRDQPANVQLQQAHEAPPVPARSVGRVQSRTSMKRPSRPFKGALGTRQNLIAMSPNQSTGRRSTSPPARRSLSGSAADHTAVETALVRPV